jgi:hypothetical protein
MLAVDSHYPLGNNPENLLALLLAGGFSARDFSFVFPRKKKRNGEESRITFSFSFFSFFFETN